MAPRFARRLIAATGVLMLLMSSSADALGLHRCAHHDALPSATETDAGHHGHHSAPADSDEQQSESCTCVGTCSISTAVLAPSANAAVAAEAPTRPSAQAPRRATPAAKSAEHLLPYSTAPPTL
jgi:hypothetical protein